MAISRMDMERQLRNMGGLMTLEEPRQGYFLGKIVRKAKKAVKKVVKSPLGKAALLGAASFGIPGTAFGGLFGRASLGGAAKGIFGNTGGIGALLGRGGKFSTLGDIFRVGGEAKEGFSVPRILAGLGIGSAVAAPFLMGGDEEVVDEGVDFTGVQPMVADIRDQAKAYYQDPTKSALYFMPPKSSVQSSFYAADGGLASIPRDGYRLGNIVQKAGSAMKNLKNALVTKLGRMTDDVEITTMSDFAEDTGASMDLSFVAKSKKGKETLDGLVQEGILDVSEGIYTPKAFMADDAVIGMEKLKASGVIEEGGKFKRFDEGAGIGEYDMPYYGYDQLIETFGRQKKAEGGLMRIGFSDGKSLKAKLKQIGYEDTLLDTMSLKELMDLYNSEQGTFTDSSVYRPGRAEGGLMDLGGFEKDYREGGFVPLGAEERADDVPARLSKNEFVFTADAVRNAGGGDIDKGAEVMQNMMDNLEAGGTISEESQGKENPAQEMFNQAQMLESRIV